MSLKKVQVKAQQSAEQLQEDALDMPQTKDAVEVDDLDDVLDDIESVLQTNAEEYVSSFVQKGGE